MSSSHDERSPPGILTGRRMPHPPSHQSTVEHHIRIGIASARSGVSVNAVLAITKIVAGIIGHSFALVADGIESTIDIVSSLIVWAGLHVSGREADDQFQFGYGKAEALAAAVVSLTLIGAAVGIAVGAVREILTPHELPAAFTLWILGAVIVCAFRSS